MREKVKDERDEMRMNMNFTNNQQLWIWDENEAVFTHSNFFLCCVYFVCYLPCLEHLDCWVDWGGFKSNIWSHKFLSHTIHKTFFSQISNLNAQCVYDDFFLISSLVRILILDVHFRYICGVFLSISSVLVMLSLSFSFLLSIFFYQLPSSLFLSLPCYINVFCVFCRTMHIQWSSSIVRIYFDLCWVIWYAGHSHITFPANLSQ